jgi:hypothetical protein
MIYQSYFVGENASVLTINSNLSLNNGNFNELFQKNRGKWLIFSPKNMQILRQNFRFRHKTVR